ncbi:MAG: phosphatidylserine decarboxylase [Candidatus Latescibacterota bacterium]|nr:MAG: phosphatidylserine decarboxylase [Candidatus Latescibacterota bacterium]
MVKPLREWVENDVADAREKPLSWLSQYFFFRDPTRPVYSDTGYFFSPADGIVLYVKTVEPDESIVDIKGIPYSLQDAMRDKSYDKRSIVVGIFMTFYDVHVNRIPYPGRLSYKELEPIDTYNYPMLDIEKGLVDEVRVNTNSARYLHNNQRMLNRIYAPDLRQHYYILQIADYDVDSITPFDLKQNQPCAQNQRFSQIRYGSQVDLIVPLSDRYEFAPTKEAGVHVEAGVDHVIKIGNR